METNWLCLLSHSQFRNQTRQNSSASQWPPAQKRNRKNVEGFFWPNFNRLFIIKIIFLQISADILFVFTLMVDFFHENGVPTKIKMHYFFWHASASTRLPKNLHMLDQHPISTNKLVLLVHSGCLCRNTTENWKY